MPSAGWLAAPDDGEVMKTAPPVPPKLIKSVAKLPTNAQSLNAGDPPEVYTAPPALAVFAINVQAVNVPGEFWKTAPPVPGLGPFGRATFALNVQPATVGDDTVGNDASMSIAPPA